MGTTHIEMMLRWAKDMKFAGSSVAEIELAALKARIAALEGHADRLEGALRGVVDHDDDVPSKTAMLHARHVLGVAK